MLSFLDIIKSQQTSTTNEITDICKNCNGNLVRNSESTTECENCGQIEYMIGDKYDNTSCSNIEGYVNIGKGKEGRIFNSINDPKKIQLANIINIYEKRQQAVKYVSETKKNIHINIPKHIFNQAANMYIHILVHTKSCRASVLNNILGACLYQECKKAQCIYTERQIANFMGLKKEGLSGGNKFLSNLYLRGLLTIDISNNVYLPFISKYLEHLDIDEKYATILEQIIFRSRHVDSNLLSDELINKYKLKKGRIYKIGSNCRIITKCAGAVYALTKLIPVSQLTNGKNNDKKITVEQIDNIGNTKKSTYGKYTNKLIQYDELLGFSKELSIYKKNE